MFPVLLRFPAFELLRQVSQRCTYSTLIHLHSENFELYILAGSRPFSTTHTCREDIPLSSLLTAVSLIKCEDSIFLTTHLAWLQLPCRFQVDLPHHQLLVLAPTRQEVTPRRKCDAVDRPLKSITYLHELYEYGKDKKLFWCKFVCLRSNEQPGVQKGCRGCRSAVGRRSLPNKTYVYKDLRNWTSQMDWIILYANH